MSYSTMKHTLSSGSEFESTDSDCDSGLDSDLPPCCKLEAQKQPQRPRQLRIPRNFPSLKFTPPSTTGSIFILQQDGSDSKRPSKTNDLRSNSLSSINPVCENEPTTPSQNTGVGIRIRKHGKRTKPCRPGKPCRPRCARCDRTGRTKRGKRCKPGRICEDGSRPCPLCEPWEYRVSVNMKNVPPPSSQPDRYLLGYPRFPLLVAMWDQSIKEALPRGRTLYYISEAKISKRAIILHSGSSKAYPPLAAWNARFPTERYDERIVVFKSGGDRSPIQRARISLDNHHYFARDPVTFSWSFLDGRKETFDWKCSGLPEVRDVNEKRHGTGMKCVRNKTGKIVAATMPLGFRNRINGALGRMAFFRWNMSNDMGDEFECMLIMSRILVDELLMRRFEDERPRSSN